MRLKHNIFAIFGQSARFERLAVLRHASSIARSDKARSHFSTRMIGRQIFIFAVVCHTDRHHGLEDLLNELIKHLVVLSMPTLSLAPLLSLVIFHDV